jgi:hypothetical protein
MQIQNSFTWFIINLQRRKIYSINTILYNIQQRNVWAFNVKKTILGTVALGARMRTFLHSSSMLQVNCSILQAVGPLIPHTYAGHFVKSKKRH